MDWDGVKREEREDREHRDDLVPADSMGTEAVLAGASSSQDSVDEPQSLGTEERERDGDDFVTNPCFS